MAGQARSPSATCVGKSGSWARVLVQGVGRCAPACAGEVAGSWRWGGSGRRGDRLLEDAQREDRKSTRLNSSHSQISYAVFCLKKKKKNTDHEDTVYR